MLRKLAHPQTTRQFTRSFRNLPLHQLGHQLRSNRLHNPIGLGVTRLPNQWGSRNTPGLRHAPWAMQVAGFHSTRRNEVPWGPLLAAVLKARSLYIGALTDINLASADVHFNGTSSNRKQGSTVTRPFTFFQ